VIFLAEGAGYAYAGWAIVTVALIGYVVWLFQRARTVEQEVPEGRRRWSDP
jgi:hypothetical protein